MKSLGPQGADSWRHSACGLAPRVDSRWIGGGI